MVFDQVPAWSVGAQLVVAGAAGVVLVDRGHRAVRAVDDRTSTWLAWFAFVLAAGLVVNVWVLSAPARAPVARALPRGHRTRLDRTSTGF